MTSIVVDVGNSRLKWGRCEGGVVVECVSLPGDDPVAWERQLGWWQVGQACVWTTCGVNPPTHDRFVEWLQARGESVRTLKSSRDLPLQVQVDNPDGVGIDRLLNAVAANDRRRTMPEHARGKAGILVDAGSAVTVDLVDESGVFRGGAILPGLRLMAMALHDHTALLPRVEVWQSTPAALGTSTRSAIEAGVHYAVVGAIRELIGKLMDLCRSTPITYLTGGDASLLHSSFDEQIISWPFMTLEGIRIAAEAGK